MIIRHWLITGRVQGVGYRRWLERAARAEEIAGWVRNLADGRVEALLHGPEDRLQRLRAAALQGPAAATVHSIDEQSHAGPVPPGPFRQVTDAAQSIRE